MKTYRFGPFCVKDNESLWLGDSLVPLSPLQLRLLSFLCSHPQQVLGKERIVAEVWGHPDVSDVSLARAIHGLRNRLAVGGKPSELIRNIYGRGYILTQAVSVSEDGGAALSSDDTRREVDTCPAPAGEPVVMTRIPSLRSSRSDKAAQRQPEHAAL